MLMYSEKITHADENLN